MVKLIFDYLNYDPIIKINISSRKFEAALHSGSTSQIALVRALVELHIYHSMILFCLIPNTIKSQMWMLVHFIHAIRDKQFISSCSKSLTFQDKHRNSHQSYVAVYIVTGNITDEVVHSRCTIVMSSIEE